MPCHRDAVLAPEQTKHNLLPVLWLPMGVDSEPGSGFLLWGPRSNIWIKSLAEASRSNLLRKVKAMGNQ